MGMIMPFFTMLMTMRVSVFALDSVPPELLQADWLYDFLPLALGIGDV